MVVKVRYELEPYVGDVRVEGDRGASEIQRRVEDVTQAVPQRILPQRSVRRDSRWVLVGIELLVACCTVLIAHSLVAFRSLWLGLATTKTQRKK